MTSRYCLCKTLNGLYSVLIESICRVEDGDLCSSVECCLYADGCGCATGSEYDKLFALDLDTILLKISDKSDSICVVSGHLAILCYSNGVACADQLRCRCHFIQILDDCSLIRHCDVEAFDVERLDGCDTLC